jgi:hypothetical protein
VTPPLARLGRVGALVLAVACLEPVGILGSRRALADREPPAQRPPMVSFGLPLPGGGALWRHSGANPPPDVPGATWHYERQATRTFGGRSVDVLRYVARDAEGQVVAVPSWDQADFVDPSSGEIVGGLDGWGKETYPAEPEGPQPCAGG